MVPPTTSSTPPLPQPGAFRQPQATVPLVPLMPWGTPSGHTPGTSSTGVPRMYSMPSTDDREHGDVVTGIISVDSFDASVLFDSGASFSFVSEGFVVRASLSMQKISQPVLVSSARGPISSFSVCLGCSIVLADEVFVANLVVIPLESFDVILGMDWLSQCQAIISYFWKTVSLQAPSGREVIFQGSAREVIFQGSAMKYSLSLLSQMFPNRWTRKSGILLAMVDGTEVALQVENIPVVCHYLDVFPNEHQAYLLSVMLFLRLNYFLAQNQSIGHHIRWLQ